MKKTTLIILLMLLVPTLRGQQRQYLEETAVRVVDKYVGMLNIEALPSDSLLVMETLITTMGSTDTFLMKRWWASPQMFRVEVWHADTLQTGLYGNGRNRWRKYYAAMHGWEDIGDALFYSYYEAYDFRGPLYSWRAQNASLSYLGTKEMKGRPFDVVKVETPDHYTRNYMFDRNNGLLTFITEESEIDGEAIVADDAHIEWKAMLEFQPIGHAMLPSLESFSRQGAVTILRSTYHMERLDTHLFNHDR